MLTEQERHRHLAKLLGDNASSQDITFVVTKSSQFLPQTQRTFQYQEEPNFYYLSGLWMPDLVFGILLTKTEVREVLLFPNEISRKAQIFYARIFGINWKRQQCEFDRKEQTKKEKTTQLLPWIYREFASEANLPPWTTESNLERLHNLSKSALVLTCPPETLRKRLQGAKVRIKWLGDYSSISLKKEFGLLRKRKDFGERKQIQAATALTVEFFQTLQRTQIWGSGGGDETKFQVDLDIEALATQTWTAKGATHSYPPIVATNQIAAKHLHGQASGLKLSAARSLLVDTGAKVHGYCCDITRTFIHPSLSSTSKERQVYEFLKKAMSYLERKVIGPGKWIREDKSNSIGGAYAKWVREEAPPEWVKHLLVHSIGHHVGLQVHDPEESPLGEDDCFAIEVGFYDAKAGIGMRIEDMYIIEKHKVRCMSASLLR